jgi:hypothetical protein
VDIFQSRYAYFGPYEQVCNSGGYDGIMLKMDIDELGSKVFKVKGGTICR